MLGFRGLGQFALGEIARGAASAAHVSDGHWQDWDKQPRAHAYVRATEPPTSDKATIRAAVRQALELKYVQPLPDSFAWISAVETGQDRAAIIASAPRSTGSLSASEPARDLPAISATVRFEDDEEVLQLFTYILASET